MNEIDAYLDAIKLGLISSPIISEYTIVKERTTATDGYVRVRATLLNGDFVELTEYSSRVEQEVTTVDYRYQWMDPGMVHLRQSWDNTPHHPDTPNFAHHVHLENDNRVIAGESMSILQVLTVLETYLEA